MIEKGTDLPAGFQGNDRFRGRVYSLMAIGGGSKSQLKLLWSNGPDGGNPSDNDNRQAERVTRYLDLSREAYKAGYAAALAELGPHYKDKSAEIPEFNMAFPPGLGQYPEDHPLTINNRTFSIQWLNKKGLQPDKLVLVRVQGDSYGTIT